MRRSDALVLAFAAFGVLIVALTLVQPAVASRATAAEETQSVPTVETVATPPATATSLLRPVATSTPPATATSVPAIVTPPPTATSPAPPTAIPASPTPEPTRAYARAGPGAGLPILMYHYVRVNPDPRDKVGYGLSVTPELFRAHAEFLAERGYRTLTMRDVSKLLALGERPSEKSVVLTFDDGYRDFYTEAWPVLKKNGLTATVFQIVDLIDNHRYLTADQLRELDASGVEIASHSLSHSDMTAVSPDRLRRELRDSKTGLERLLGRPVESFCYPSGKQNLAVRKAVADAGYTTAVTVEPGVFRYQGDRVAIPRVRVYGGMGLSQLARSLGEEPPDRARWAQFLGDRPNP